MIIVSGATNTITYISRYNAISKYEIIDHSTNEIYSGLTNIVGIDGKIEHSGITYNFTNHNYYTYKSYYTFDSGATYNLANQTLLRHDYVSNYNELIKTKNIFNGKKY